MLKKFAVPDRSVVLALRGTTSVEDIITDSVAEPERLDPAWISKALRPQEDEAARLYAHAGIKAAADAVLKASACVLHGNYTRNLNFERTWHMLLLGNGATWHHSKSPDPTELSALCAASLSNGEIYAHFIRQLAVAKICCGFARAGFG